MQKKPLINKIGEVRELTAKDITAMKSASEVLPNDLLKVLPKHKVRQHITEKSSKNTSSTIHYSKHPHTSPPCDL